MAERDLKALFQAHGRALELYLNRRTGCPALAADLLQDAFLRLVQQPPEAGARNLRAYLYRIAGNLALDHFRQEARRRTEAVPAERLAAVEDETPDVERALAARERLQRLEQALARLPPRTREIFRLNRVEGLTYLEIAARLGISESSVQKHLARALQQAMRAARRN
ncbi:RNA polymerase sigma-70 factor, ECF subfamily [Tistlia consotensis]|uniref:RNA polymerase sigma-70 factor, ECF subfamily n=1 Tax=Tistlia consotensis USBA 355 TaxID=560819 RepID=A0A1Y6C7N3_9PROT|nr:RNA polymerase sigma factor [Tistlia consotensis]SMF48174.1 RNA polymerase sigma-70 factor, ECF subfamily [Tistlia consotensis USBA 355]SNR81718.1 RNA polymerase sigma-70 factor, ECF subfamily [Tistlia consotensis]